MATHKPLNRRHRREIKQLYTNSAEVVNRRGSSHKDQQRLFLQSNLKQRNIWNVASDGVRAGACSLQRRASFEREDISETCEMTQWMARALSGTLQVWGYLPSTLREPPGSSLWGRLDFL